MKGKAYIKFVRTSPKKLRFLIDDIKKMTPAAALTALQYSAKRSAKVLYKAIKSAVDNIKAEVKDQSGLKFEALIIEEGPALKRMRAGGRGTAKLFKRRSSHIKVIVSDEK